MYSRGQRPEARKGRDPSGAPPYNSVVCAVCALIKDLL